MGAIDKVRANKFDAWVGEYQTRKAMELGTGDSILDIGCGIGQFTPIFCERFSEVIGLDPSKEYLDIARQSINRVTYVKGWGETFKFNRKFDTINMTNLLEHVDDPIKLLKNCKRHLNKGGRIIAQVPNSDSITRRIGVLMDIIDSLDNISEKERDYYGHQRTYNLDSLSKDFTDAGLKIVDIGGFLYKPLSNEMLYEICDTRTDEWRHRFIQALIEFGKNRPDECAQLYICAR